jgi:hypothetical protein
VAWCIHSALHILNVWQSALLYNRTGSKLFSESRCARLVQSLRLGENTQWGLLVLPIRQSGPTARLEDAWRRTDSIPPRVAMCLLACHFRTGIARMQPLLSRSLHSVALWLQKARVRGMLAGKLQSEGHQAQTAPPSRFSCAGCKRPTISPILPDSTVAAALPLCGFGYCITLQYTHSTDRHVLAIMQADLCRAHPHDQKVMPLYLLKA